MTQNSGKYWYCCLLRCISAETDESFQTAKPKTRVLARDVLTTFRQVPLHCGKRRWCEGLVRLIEHSSRPNSITYSSPSCLQRLCSVSVRKITTQNASPWILNISSVAFVALEVSPLSRRRHTFLAANTNFIWAFMSACAGVATT